ncbi:MAG: CRTAC1 family protein [Acidobacteria bacterium]|nr:MAG: CRTAC1 family protein [Acidobacteriota bacterium]PYY22708.1 MAG: CRTAC1 family protein [Acidobacteriota bacterium]
MNKSILRLSLVGSILVYTIASAQNSQFTNITQAAGIHFVHNNGATGKRYLPETLGVGVAFIDYDNDGSQDILFANSEDWPGAPKHPSTLKLYHNNRNGTFTDVTQKSGLGISMYGMGIAVGDYDNDGYDDVFVSAVGQSRLFHNNGNGTFSDVSQKAGMTGVQEFSTSAAWVDYDRDGKLDLIIANYVRWSPKEDIYCSIDGKRKSYCTPESYKGASIRVWHNLGNGKFEDATAQLGLLDLTSKTLGIAVLDYNKDGWPDFVLSNDTQPNKLYVNDKGTRFSEVAVTAGIAYSEEGLARAGMGVDAADYDRSGNPSILISNFSNQMLSLFHNEGHGLFVDVAPTSEIGRDSLLTLGFGCFFFDYDLDGWLDIFVANGHIEDQIENIQKRVRYAEPPHLFHNLGNGKFTEVTERMGAEFARPRVARGAAYADIDNDGDLDLVMTTNGGPAQLFRNDTKENQSLRIKLEGTKSNRDGIGTVVHVHTGAGEQALMMRSGSSYLSQSELVLTFGLANSTKADRIDIDWPSGQHEILRDVPAGQMITVREGAGIKAGRKFGPRS